MTMSLEMYRYYFTTKLFRSYGVLKMIDTLDEHFLTDIIYVNFKLMPEEVDALLKQRNNF